MRIQLIALSCVVLSGCTFGLKTCTTNEQCETGSTCGPGGFCYVNGENTGGGSTTGGGSATGGGTGTGGGTTTGGGTATDGGDDGGVDAGPICPTLNCAEACIEPTGCVPYFSGIEIVFPDAGARLKQAPVTVLEARMVPTAGVTVLDANYPAALLYLADDGGMAQLLKAENLNEYAASLDTSSCGASTIFAGIVSLEDGGLGVPSNFTCDGQPPTVTVPAMPNYFQRDDVTLLQLTVSEPLDLSATTVKLGSATLALADAGCSDAGPCYVMDLSAPAFPYVDAGVQLTITAKDLVGYSTVFTPQTIKITRVRWTASLPNPVIAAPAVSPSGDIIVGVANTSTGGGVYRLDGVSGTLDAGNSVGAVQGVAVAPSDVFNVGTSDVVFAAYNSGAASPGILEGFFASSLDPITGLSASSGNNGRYTYMAPALVQRAPGVVAGLGAAVSGGGQASKILYWSGTEGRIDPVTLSGADSDGVNHQNVSPRVNAVIQEAATSPHANFIQYGTFLFWTSGGVVRVSGLTSTPTLQTTYASALDAGGAHTQTPFGANASLVSNPGSSSVKEIVRADPTDAGAGGSWTFGDGTIVKGAVALEAANKGYAGFGSSVVSFDPSNPSVAFNQVVALPDVSDTFLVSPVLLSAAPQSSAWGYAVSTKGVLAAFTRSGAPLAWSSAIQTAGASVVAHPSFGCNTRPGAASGTGVLYIGFDDGKVRAIVVDGPTLEGVWPKYQRTMGNAGNDDETNFPTNWPGICPP